MSESDNIYISKYPLLFILIFNIIFFIILFFIYRKINKDRTNNFIYFIFYSSLILIVNVLLVSINWNQNMNVHLKKSITTNEKENKYYIYSNIILKVLFIIFIYKLININNNKELYLFIQLLSIFIICLSFTNDIVFLIILLIPYLLLGVYGAEKKYNKITRSDGVDSDDVSSYKSALILILGVVMNFIILNLIYSDFIPSIFVWEKSNNINHTQNLLFIFFLFYTIVLLLKSFNKDVEINTYFNNFNWSIISFIIFVCILIPQIFSLLYNSTNGFSKTLVSNNYLLLYDLIGLIIILIFANRLFNSSASSAKSKEYKDDSLSKGIFPTYLIIILVTLFVFFLYNPLNYSNKYADGSSFLILFVGFIIFAIIKFYQQFLITDKLEFTDLSKILLAVMGLTFSSLLIFFIFRILNFSSKDGNFGMKIFNLLLILVILRILYYYIEVSGILGDNIYLKIILDILFYIPCLITIIVNKLYNFFSRDIDELTKNISKGKERKDDQDKKGVKKGEKILKEDKDKDVKDKKNMNDYFYFLIAILIIVSYYILSHYLYPIYIQKFFNLNGMQLLKCAIDTNKETIIASYKDINKLSDEDNKPNYTYTLSFWFYINSFIPSSNGNYIKIIPILNYGNNPCISYEAYTNTLYITINDKDTKQATFTELIDDLEKINETKIDISELHNEFSDTKMIENYKRSLNTNRSVNDENIYEKINKIKELSVDREFDELGNRIIYKNKNVLLQRWNNLVLNVDGSNMDIFLNGILVKSLHNALNYINFKDMVVGYPNGINGSVANILYFQNNINVYKIKYLYYSLKNKNPPCIENIRKLV